MQEQRDTTVEVEGGGAKEGPAQEPAPAAEGMPSSLQRGDEEDEVGPGSLETLSSDFDRVLMLATPDCPNASRLRDQICDLSRRICHLSDTHRGDPELAERCGDGRARCQRATDRLQSACP